MRRMSSRIRNLNVRYLMVAPEGDLIDQELEMLVALVITA